MMTDAPTLNAPTDSIDDYLAYRGYPLSSWNRALVAQKIRECPPAADRKQLRKHLDRLLRRH